MGLGTIRPCRALKTPKCAPQVYTPSLPPSGLTAALPSQPMVQFILRSSLPPAAGAVAPGPALVPAVGSEPASQGATNNSEDKGAVPPRPAAEKATKNEEVGTAAGTHSCKHMGQGGVLLPVAIHTLPSSVPQEAAHTGARSRRGEIGHQALLPAAGGDKG